MYLVLPSRVEQSIADHSIRMISFLVIKKEMVFLETKKEILLGDQARAPS